MNFRLIIFSGIMAALIGAMMGLAVTRIAQKVERRPIFLITGASLGFAIGTFQECIRQQKNERDEEENNE